MPDGLQLPPEIAFLIDFNMQSVPAVAGLNVPPQAAAAMFGISELQYSAYVDAARAAVEADAITLLLERRLVEGLDWLRVWLPAGGKLMTAGDSITTYRCGYAELLRVMLARRFPADGLRLINAGQSGFTSTHAREYVHTQLLEQQPDLVLIMYGVNDCKRFGAGEERTLVPPGEYRENMSVCVEAFLAYSEARPVLMTPTPVVEHLVRANPGFHASRVTWRNSDIEKRADIIRDLAKKRSLPCVDLAEAFGPQPDPVLYLPDGLHPGPAGHRLILEQILKTLSRRREK